MLDFLLELPYIGYMTQRAMSMYQQADRSDAALFSLYARAQWNRRGWLMILSGLAAFNRFPKEV